MDSVVKSAQRAYRKLQRTVQGETVYSVGISGRQNPTASYYGATSSSPEASPAGWIAAGIAAAGLAYVVWGRSVRWPWASKRRGEGGRWVRDRSLGGKMVFIPNGAAGTSTTRPLWEDDDEFSSELVTAAASGAVSAVSAGASTDATPQELVPEWWSPPSSASYVSAGRKEELHKQAKAALRQLEDAKMLRGEDYSLSGMVALRSLCSQAGGLQVRAHTESGRDAILRAAVRAAINASLRSSNPASALGGYEPGRFVSGLAHDLAVPDKRAVTIVHAEVAATCRGALIDAEAAYRIGSQDDLVRALQRLVVCLGAFPLPPGSPEAELVGRSFVKHATLEFRKAVFMGAGSYDLAVAPLVAEMLGFDPQLVMPQLLTQVAAMTQAGQASQPPATQE